jgi:hypothetical protein
LKARAKAKRHRTCYSRLYCTADVN